MGNGNSNLVGGWIFFLLAPPVTLIIVIELSKVLFGLGFLYGGLFLVAGIVVFIAEVYELISRTKEALGFRKV